VRLAWVLVLAGCAASVPAPVPPAGGLAAANGAWEGRYEGLARRIEGTGSGCQGQFGISDFHVTANRVSYGAFFGTIRPNGDAILESEGPIIDGRFNVGMFTGTIRRRADGCDYDIAVARAGP